MIAACILLVCGGLALQRRQAATEEALDALQAAARPLAGKVILLAGDSRSSTDYDFYGAQLEQKTGAVALVCGASGRNAAYNASNAYFECVEANPHDFSIWLVGGNDDGSAGTVGTFSADSELAKLGEAVVAETDVAQDYGGSCFIQAVDHMMRKYKAAFYDFKALDNGHVPVSDAVLHGPAPAAGERG